MVPFDYQNKVSFDTDNPPLEVYVGTLLSGLRTTSMAYGRMHVAVFPAIPVPNSASWSIKRDAQPYSGLYGPASTFRAAEFGIIKNTRAAFTVQFTLFLHRVNLPSETPSTNGYYFALDVVVNGNIQTSSSNPTYNTVAPGPGIIGIVGFCDFWQHGATAASGMSVNYTSPQSISLSSHGYSSNYLDYFGLFYSFVCDSSCETCDGPLPSQCLTCPTALAAYRGKCTCPVSSTTLGNNFVCVDNGCSSYDAFGTCTSCKQNAYRVRVPDSKGSCPCVTGLYEDATSKCVPCPTDQNCATCQLSAGGAVDCLSCSCAKHRELVGTSCNCLSGFQEATPPSPYCRRTL